MIWRCEDESCARLRGVEVEDIFVWIGDGFCARDGSTIEEKVRNDNPQLSCIECRSKWAKVDARSRLDWMSRRNVSETWVCSGGRRNCVR